jgi:hypothetical protein
MGRSQVAVTLANPAVDPRKAQMCAIALVDSGRLATQRNEQPGYYTPANASVLSGQIKWRDSTGVDRNATLAFTGFSANVRQLESASTYSLPLPEYLPDSPEKVSDRSKWVKVGWATKLYFLLAFSVQSVAEVEIDTTSGAQIVVYPGVLLLYGSTNEEGEITLASFGTADVPWLSVTRCDFGVTVGPRRSSE